MSNNNSTEESKQKRQIHKYAKTNPNDPGPYTKETIPEKTPEKTPEKKKVTDSGDST